MKEAVIKQVAQELCTTLRQRESSFNATEDAMKQALASALIESQRKVVSNPPASRNIKGAQVLEGSQTACPMAVCLMVPLVQVPQAELQPQKSAVMSGPGSSMSAGSLGLADFWIPRC